MIFSTVNKIPAYVLEKLDLLFQLLRERKAEYEIFAGNVADKALKQTVLSLAQETNQYAIELSHQIESMAGINQKKYETPDGAEEKLKPFVEGVFQFTGEKDILNSCEVSETRMIKAYRTVLNEPFLHDNLRKLIRSQLNGITYAFMQVRLLNTSLR